MFFGMKDPTMTPFQIRSHCEVLVDMNSRLGDTGPLYTSLQVGILILILFKDGMKAYSCLGQNSNSINKWSKGGVVIVRPKVPDTTSIPRRCSVHIY